MELIYYEVNDHVETGGKFRNFEAGNGYWWQNSFSYTIGYGFGFKEDFRNTNGIYYGVDDYCTNLIFQL